MAQELSNFTALPDMVPGNEEFLLLNPEKRTTSRVLAPLTHHGSTSGLPHQQVQCWTAKNPQDPDVRWFFGTRYADMRSIPVGTALTAAQPT